MSHLFLFLYKVAFSVLDDMAPQIKGENAFGVRALSVPQILFT